MIQLVVPNDWSTTLGDDYAPGGGVMDLAPGEGATLLAVLAEAALPPPADESPLVFKVMPAAATARPQWTLFRATGLVGDQLRGVVAVEGRPDQSFPAGTPVTGEVTAGLLAALFGGIAAIEADATIVRTTAGYPDPDFVETLDSAKLTGTVDPARIPALPYQPIGSYQPADPDLADIAAIAPTRGRLLVGDGTHWQPLPVGTDGQVLTADAARAAGAKWASPWPAGWVDPTAPPYSARGDAVLIYGAAAITAGSTALAVAGAGFVAGDVGKSICVQGAGPTSNPLRTTIAAVVDAAHATLAAAAGTTVPNGATPAGGSDCCYGTDDTAAIQSALDAGYPVVYLGARKYFCAGTLDVPRNTCLLGPWQGPPAHDGPYLDQPSGVNAPDAGVLFTTQGAGSAAGAPFLKLHQNSGVKGLVIYQPSQSHALSGSPVAHPYLIQLTDGANGYVIDSELTNPYQGIWLGDATGAVATACNRGTVQNVTGQPIAVGLYAQNCYDSTYLRRVHWIPLYAYSNTDVIGSQNGSSPLAGWQYTNGIGFLIGGVDDLHAVDCFGYQYSRVYKFVAEGTHATGSSGGYGTFSNCSGDGCFFCVEMVSSNRGYTFLGGSWAGQAGVFLVTGGNLTSDGAIVLSGAPFAGGGGTMLLANCNALATGNLCDNSVGELQVVGGQFSGGFRTSTGSYQITGARVGGTVTLNGAGTLMMTGVRLTATGNQVVVAAGATAFSVVGCVGNGGVGIADSSGLAPPYKNVGNNGAY